MRLSSSNTDEVVLLELGARLSGARLARNLTQAELAQQAGISKRTVERLESGEVATQFSSFIRVCRVLELMERLDQLIPEPQASPLAQIKRQPRRKRASGSRAAPIPEAAGLWTWKTP